MLKRIPRSSRVSVPPLRRSQIYFEITNNGFEILLELSVEKITVNETARVAIFHFIALAFRTRFRRGALFMSTRENKGTIHGENVQLI